MDPTRRDRTARHLAKLREFLGDSHERRLLVTVATDATGSGLFIAGAALFYVKVAGLSSGQIGIGLSVMGVVGLLAALPNGALADRIGPRRALIALHLWRAVWCSVLAFVSSFPQFLAAVILLGLAEYAGMPALQAYVAGAFSAERRVALMARIQTVKNTGFLCGALLAAVAVGSGSPWGYRLLLLGDGLSFLVAAVLMVTLRAVAAGPAVKRVRRKLLAPLKNPGFAVLTVCNGILMLNFSVLTIGIPLWIVHATRAPAALGPVLLVVNTVMAITLQVPLSRGADTVRGAGRHTLRSGCLLALMCLVLAAAAYPGVPTAAVVLLVVAVVLQTLGEIWYSSGGWGLQFALAPEGEQGSYAAAFGLGSTTEGMVGPTLVGAGVVSAGAAGWGLLAAVFLAAGVASWMVAARAASRSAPAGTVGVEPEVTASADRRAESAGTAGDLATAR